MNVPDAVGVPLMVMVLLAHVALTPAGKPLAPDTPALEMPVAPVVVCVMLVKAVLMQSVGVLDAAPTVLLGLTVTVALPDIRFVQAGLEANATLTKLYVNAPAVPVGTATVTELPLVVVTV